MSRLLNHLIETATQARPEAEALAYRGVRLSYGELQQSIEAPAADFQALQSRGGPAPRAEVNNDRPKYS